MCSLPVYGIVSKCCFSRCLWLVLEPEVLVLVLKPQVFVLVFVVEP